MNQSLKQFQTWLLEKRHLVFSWFYSDQKETPEPEETLAELPPALAEKLIKATQNLPSNPADQEAVRSTLDSAFKQWRSHPQTADNSLAVLSSPVASVARILTESIEDWGAEHHIRVRLLQWIARPSDPENIKMRLQKQLGRGLSTANPQQLEVVVIPNLSWCFLRCFEGLEGIEYLRDVLLQDRSRFWVIGAGQIGWEYLQAVCNIKAYCEEFILPDLNGEQLQKWFAPIVSELNITFSQPRFNHKSKEDQDPQASYFEKLASISQGVSTVAVQIFLRSIHTEATEERQAEIQKEQSPSLLQAQSPSLPDLPDLEPDDHYLLYSILLHGDLTMSSLANSLGDERSVIQGRVQVLRRAGVIEQKNEMLTVNPIHYPKLVQELSSNNFINNIED